MTLSHGGLKMTVKTMTACVGCGKELKREDRKYSEIKLMGSREDEVGDLKWISLGVAFCHDCAKQRLQPTLEKLAGRMLTEDDLLAIEAGMAKINACAASIKEDIHMDISSDHGDVNTIMQATSDILALVHKGRREVRSDGYVLQARACGECSM